MNLDSMDLLIIEDNPGDVVLAKEILSQVERPVSIRVAEDGETALSMLDEHLPNMVLLDLNLPRISGQDVLRAIRENPKSHAGPVIVFSTSDAERDVVAAYNGGANCYITKPVDLDRFFKVVRSIENFWLDVVRLPAS